MHGRSPTGLAPAASILALVALDVVGLALGLMRPWCSARSCTARRSTGRCSGGRARGVASVPRSRDRAGLLAGGPLLRRASGGRVPGRVVASLVLVALIVLAFGLGTDYDFTTTGLIPTAVVTCALAIGVLRAAYDSAPSS